MSIEAMKMALEALETLDSGDSYKTHNAATALRKAIEQAEKREWVGLTREEKSAVRNSVEYSQFMSAEEYASLVQYETEAKLKEKNRATRQHKDLCGND